MQNTWYVSGEHNLMTDLFFDAAALLTDGVRSPFSYSNVTGYTSAAGCVCARVFGRLFYLLFFLLISGPCLHLVPLISSHVFTGESKTWQHMEKKRARSNPLLFQKYQLVRRGDGIDGEKQS